MLLLLALLLLAPTHSLGAAPPAANAACDAACQAAQRAALVRLYAAWGGARWVRSHSWNSTGSVCNWSGVVCCVDGSKITEALAFDGDVALTSAFCVCCAAPPPPRRQRARRARAFDDVHSTPKTQRKLNRKNKKTQPTTRRAARRAP